MILSELIKELQALEAEHGDLKVCSTADNEYWGTLYNEVTKVMVEINAQPDGLRCV